MYSSSTTHALTRSKRRIAFLHLSHSLVFNSFQWMYLQFKTLFFMFLIKFFNSEKALLLCFFGGVKALTEDYNYDIRNGCDN